MIMPVSNMPKTMSNMTNKMQEEMQRAMPNFGKFYVVLHGLICVRMSYKTRTVQLVFPSVPMHVYHYKRFGALSQPLPYGDNYRLEGLRAGSWYPNASTLAHSNVTVPLSSYSGVEYAPRGTHATVTLPWPHEFGGLYKIKDVLSGTYKFPLPKFLFNYPDVNPRGLFYTPYLKYRVGPEAVPVLTRCCQPMPYQDPIGLHDGMGFFADPPVKLNDATYGAHVPDAYQRLNDQIFLGQYPLMPNIDSDDRWEFDRVNDQKDIPNGDAVDYWQVDKQERRNEKRQPIKVGTLYDGTGGNCLPCIVTDGDG